MAIWERADCWGRSSRPLEYWEDKGLQILIRTHRPHFSRSRHRHCRRRRTRGAAFTRRSTKKNREADPATGGTPHTPPGRRHQSGPTAVPQRRRPSPLPVR